MAIKYLLDTCIVSLFIRGNPNVLVKLKETPPQFVALSTVTCMEIAYGLQLNPAVARKIQKMIEVFLQSVSVLPYEASDAQTTATLRAKLKSSGTPIGAYDALIAGTALSRGLTLVTHNMREFSYVSGLQVIDWSLEE